MKQGERYGKLVFLEDYKVELNGKMVSVGLGKFLCGCGNEYIGNLSSIKSGNTRSYNCLLKEHSVKAMKEKNIKYGTNIGKIKTNLPTKRNKTGVIGVNWNNGKKRWEASIGFQRKKYKKRFKSFDDAVAWRKEMEEKLFASFLEKLV